MKQHNRQHSPLFQSIRVRLSSATRRYRRWTAPLLLLALLVVLILGRPFTPATWQPRDVKVAFWAWQSHTPSSEEVEDAIGQARAGTLFLRAGMIEYSGKGLTISQKVTGEMPRNIEIHLVYNASSGLLRFFEQASVEELARAVASSFSADCNRASAGGASVRGLQLDFDVPTRLLPRYAELLRELKRTINPSMMLSITGLPTWMSSVNLVQVLVAVDFWIPQFYGAEVPDTLDRRVPIASADSVRLAVDRARGLGKPFYAGLASFSWALHYSREGRLIGLQGDIDPLTVSRHPAMELVERRSFEATPDAGEWRYVFRARSDCSMGAMVMEAGEYLVLDVPTLRSLSACARAVRERAGSGLLGICIFRLPAAGDLTSLSTREIACALDDSLPPEGPGNSMSTAGIRKDRKSIILTVSNESPLRSMIGPSAMTILCRVVPGSISGVRPGGGCTVEYLSDSFSPCSSRRASLVRVSGNSWIPGQKLEIGIDFNQEAPSVLSLEGTLQRDDGKLLSETREISIEDGRYL